ncbi:hypothetical protein L3Y34_013584 [Caenorhabditis briggsae]|uniref:Uncharacterized protein n=1 Tax=Caenorhabditis briggsae TaxID=6238 RepID=A0AAE8ZXB7_CAEBR|nr:hypothetical protein L3Y34_013584 [Caenorhabditis briggsae]
MPGVFSRHSSTVGIVPTPVVSQKVSAQLQYANPHSVLDKKEASSGISDDACSTKIGIGVCIVLALFFVGFVAMEYCVLK